MNSLKVLLLMVLMLPAVLVVGLVKCYTQLINLMVGYGDVHNLHPLVAAVWQPYSLLCDLARFD